MTASPENFIREFSTLWAARDAERLAALMSDDAEVLTLTGAWCEGRKAITTAFQAELSGTFARSRLVTGKNSLRPLGPGAAVLHQRFVLSGLVNETGQDVGRLGAILTAVLVARSDGWQAVTLHFTATAS